MLDEFFTSCIKFNSCFISYKRQSQKVKVSTDNPFSSCATECIQGIPHLEIRNSFCNSKTVYISPFKITLNNVTTLFLCLFWQYVQQIRKKNKGTIFFLGDTAQSIFIFLYFLACP